MIFLPILSSLNLLYIFILIFRTLFIKHGKADNTNEIQNEDEQIVQKVM
ncbi:hypothetical protein ROSINTL182_07674 [Roseburia intestinalis L1-82]|uniref:Uncharacterized protein n=1 Tax=Roseburia intestinalis L1-82 TaxID=536231 RepID=C7GCN6_9FIRM|nr:hypothetical protein ROSINTL182_07674 [Roseburia intestinalis L1-82]